MPAVGGRCPLSTGANIHADDIMGIFFLVLPNMVHNSENGRKFATKNNSIFRLYYRNWPMRVKWAPFCNFRGPLSRKESPKRYYWYRLLHGKTGNKSDWPDALPLFWNILGN